MDDGFHEPSRGRGASEVSESYQRGGQILSLDAWLPMDSIAHPDRRYFVIN